MKKHLPFHLIFCTFILFPAFAAAQGMKDTLSRLEMLDIQYGINQIRVGHHDVVITKAKSSSISSHSDGYTAFLKGADEFAWITVEGKTFIEAHLHTYEDSLSNIRFFKNDNDLYAVYGQRPLRDSYAPSPARFSFFVLYQEEDGSILFKPVETYETQAAYCNIDWAFHQEFKLPLRSQNNEQPCPH